MKTNDENEPQLFYDKASNHSFLCERAIAIYNSHLVKIIVTDHFSHQPIVGAVVELNIIQKPQIPDLKESFISVADIKVDLSGETDSNGSLFVAFPRHFLCVIPVKNLNLKVKKDGFDDEIQQISNPMYSTMLLNEGNLFTEVKSKVPFIITSDEAIEMDQPEYHQIQMRKKVEPNKIHSNIESPE